MRASSKIGRKDKLIIQLKSKLALVFFKNKEPNPSICALKQGLLLALKVLPKR